MIFPLVPFVTIVPYTLIVKFAPLPAAGSAVDEVEATEIYAPVGSVNVLPALTSKVILLKLLAVTLQFIKEDAAPTPVPFMSTVIVIPLALALIFEK